MENHVEREGICTLSESWFKNFNGRDLSNFSWYWVPVCYCSREVWVLVDMCVSHLCCWYTGVLLVWQVFGVSLMAVCFLSPGWFCTIVSLASRLITDKNANLSLSSTDETPPLVIQTIGVSTELVHGRHQMSAQVSLFTNAVWSLAIVWPRLIRRYGCGAGGIPFLHRLDVVCHSSYI